LIVMATAMLANVAPAAAAACFRFKLAPMRGNTGFPRH
jgi:hypothetical protein